MHPDKGLDQWYLMRALPEGMLALLQAASSKKKRSELAESAVFNDDEMKEAFINFLRLIIEGHEHSAYRGLAAREKASLETCKLHKKLLLNVFHPDKMPLSKHPYIVQQIQDSYEQVKTDQSIPLYYSSTPENTEDLADDQFGSVKVNNAPRPSTAYRRHQQKNHINYVLLSGVMGLILVGIMIVLVVPSTPQSIVRQTPIIPLQTPAEVNKITLAGNTLEKNTSTQPLTESYRSSPLKNRSRVQLLINELESALEGELMNELQSRGTPSQSSKQLNDLFITSDQKKVFLHSFSWKPSTTGFYGEGRFLSRFQFLDREQWLTRSGKFFITLTESNSKLRIKQFHFEDNLH